MIRLSRSLALAAAGAFMLTTTVANAEATRPGSSIPTVSKAVTAKMSERASQPVKKGEHLSGTSLALWIVGLVGAAVAVAAISKKSDSRG